MAEKILHIDSESGWRGGEAQVLQLCIGLKTLDYDPLLVVSPQSALETQASRANLDIVPLKMRSEYNVRTILSLRRLIKHEGIALCHAHTAHAHSLAWGATARTLAVPVVVSRRVDFSVGRNYFSRLKYQSPRVYFIAISHGVKQVLLKGGILEERIFVVPSGIDAGKFRDEVRTRQDFCKEFNLSPDTVIVGNIAHLADHKGQRYLVEAVPEVLGKCPNAVFFIVGEGDERPALEQLISKLDLRSKVILTGFREDIGYFLRAFDVFVLSSHLEGLCTSLLDALLMEVPVVATRTGGVPEIIEDNVTGLLVEVRNPHALAEGIIRLIREPALCRQFAKAGRERVLTRFTTQQMVRGTVAVYEKVLAAHSRVSGELD